MSYGACFGALNAQHPNSYRVRTDGPQLWPGWKRPRSFQAVEVFIGYCIAWFVSFVHVNKELCLDIVDGRPAEPHRRSEISAETKFKLIIHFPGSKECFTIDTYDVVSIELQLGLLLRSQRILTAPHPEGKAFI